MPVEEQLLGTVQPNAFDPAAGRRTELCLEQPGQVPRTDSGRRGHRGQAVVADPAADHSLPVMAASVAVSPRHLTRLFQAELRTTPGRWVERVRLDRAQQLLLDGHSITSAARLSGLGSDETLRRAFARHLGTTPTEYRRRFRATT